jgi:hypothetical protein
MEENSVNQRIKFLIETELKTNVHRFSKLLSVSDGTVRNYVDSKTKPGAEFLALMIQKVPGLQAHWLLTGEGDPIIADKPDSRITQTGDFNQAGTSNKQTIKGNRGTVQNNTGSGNTITNNVKLDDCKRDLEAAQRENEYLRGKLQDKEELLAAKEETITLLRASFNRPN